MNTSPEYLRAVRGAFLWATIGLHAELKIRVDEEDRASPFTALLGCRWPVLPLRVTVSHPFGRPDPRGPDSGESVHMTFDKQGRMVRGRPPAEVAAVVPPGLSAVELAKHALATRVRLNRELDRGYRAVQGSVPPPDHIAAERALLPQWAMSTSYREAFLRESMGGLPVAAEEVLDGELVHDFTDEIVGLHRYITAESPHDAGDRVAHEQRERASVFYEAQGGLYPPLRDLSRWRATHRQVDTRSILGWPGLD